MFTLAGKIALVTGSSRGLGAGIARGLAEAGADVVVNYMSSKEKAMAVVEDIKHIGTKSIGVCADVGKEEDVKHLFDQLYMEFGRLDILVNNAGIYIAADIFNTSLELWNRTLETNLTSTFLCSKYAMELMVEQKHGRIISISSMSGQLGTINGTTHYAATKAGQVAFTKTLAKTAAPYNITVNAIAPGVIATDLLYQVHSEEKRKELAEMIPLGLGEVLDVAAAVVYLASDEAKFITGATLDINGGMYVR